MFETRNSGIDLKVSSAITPLSAQPTRVILPLLSGWSKSSPLACKRVIDGEAVPDGSDPEQALPASCALNSLLPQGFLTASFSSGWKDLLQDLLHRGTSAGADLVEVFMERTDHLGLLAEQDTITSVNPSFSRGADARLSEWTRWICQHE